MDVYTPPQSLPYKGHNSPPSQSLNVIVDLLAAVVVVAGTVDMVVLESSETPVAIGAGPNETHRNGQPVIDNIKSQGIRPVTARTYPTEE